MFKKILNFLNIKVQPYQHFTLFSCFFSLLFHSYYGPVLLKVAVSELPAQYLAFETVWCCLTSLIMGICWKGKFRKFAIKNFSAFALIESIAGFCLAMWLAFVSWNVWIYSIFALLYVSLITFTIGRCVMVFKTKLWNEKSRELYDNTYSIVADFALVFGACLSMIFSPSLKLALILYGCSCIIDDIGWILLWHKLKEKLIEV